MQRDERHVVGATQEATQAGDGRTQRPSEVLPREAVQDEVDAKISMEKHQC